jgi:lipid-A-disaccharide synthase
MADSVHPTLPKAVVCERHNLRSDKNTITFLPGSRAFQLNFMLPFYIKIANLLAKKDPEAQFVFSVSPFTAIDDLSRFLPERSRLITANGLNYIITDEDLRILIAKDLNYEIINISTLCVTIPGTNTAQLAALGKPMVVVFPLNQPDAIPVEGLLNLITALPLIGKYIKKILAHIINENTRFFSLPNQKAGQEIVPEIRGIITAEAVADKITEQLNRPEQLNLLSTALLTIMGEKNAPQNLSEEIKSLIREDVTHK